MTTRREAHLLRAMAQTTSEAERRRLAASLEKYRTSRRAKVNSEQGATPSAPRRRRGQVTAAKRATTTSDWLSKIATAPKGFENRVVAEATHWLSKVDEDVRADLDEFGVQTLGMAHATSGQYGEHADAAAEIFISTVARLSGVKIAADEDQSDLDDEADDADDEPISDDDEADPAPDETDEGDAEEEVEEVTEDGAAESIDTEDAADEEENITPEARRSSRRRPNYRKRATRKRAFNPENDADWEMAEAYNTSIDIANTQGLRPFDEASDGPLLRSAVEGAILYGESVYGIAAEVAQDYGFAFDSNAENYIWRVSDEVKRELAREGGRRATRRKVAAYSGPDIHIYYTGTLIDPDGWDDSPNYHREDGWVDPDWNLWEVRDNREEVTPDVITPDVINEDYDGDVERAIMDTITDRIGFVDHYDGRDTYYGGEEIVNYQTGWSIFLTAHVYRDGTTASRRTSRIQGGSRATRRHHPRTATRKQANDVEEYLERSRQRMKDRPDLIEQADAAYDRRDQGWFDSQSLEDLTFLWEVNPMGMLASWDDEVYEALYARGHFASRKQANNWDTVRSGVILDINGRYTYEIQNRRTSENLARERGLELPPGYLIGTGFGGAHSQHYVYLKPTGVIRPKFRGELWSGDADVLEVDVFTVDTVVFGEGEDAYIGGQVGEWIATGRTNASLMRSAQRKQANNWDDLEGQLANARRFPTFQEAERFANENESPTGSWYIDSYGRLPGKSGQGGYYVTSGSIASGVVMESIASKTANYWGPSDAASRVRVASRRRATRRTAVSKVVRSFYHDFGGINGFVVEIEHDPYDSYSRSVQPAAIRYWKNNGSWEYNASVGGIYDDSLQSRLGLPTSSSPDTALSYFVFVRPEDADAYNDFVYP